jgi:hypothetical protein
MKELPYFKFYPAEWMKGDITLCSMEAQGLFINICNFYWMKGCNMSLTGVQHRFNTCSTPLDELIKHEICIVENEKIVIKFLDEQFKQFKQLSKVKSLAGKASAKMRTGNTRSTDVKQVLNKREERRKEEKRKEKNINIPTHEEFCEYALSKKPDLDIDSVRLKYEAWVEGGWIDGNGKPIKNWKSKLLNTIPYLKVTDKTHRPYGKSK